MTPQEKAKQLYSQFEDEIVGLEGDEWFYSSKRCSLKAVDEILEAIKGIYDYDFQSLNPYWEEVKKEIEKL